MMLLKLEVKYNLKKNKQWKRIKFVKKIIGEMDNLK